MTARSAWPLRHLADTPDFVGGLGLVLGIAIGNTVTQDRLRRELPAAIVQELLDGNEQLTFGLINRAPSLCVAAPRRRSHSSDAAAQALVRDAMGSAFRMLWLSMAGICGLGVRLSPNVELTSQLVTTLFVSQLELHAVTDEDWGFEPAPAKTG